MSTEDSIVHFTNNIYKSVDVHAQNNLFFAVSFDTVNHKQLVDNIKLCAFRKTVLSLFECKTSEIDNKLSKLTMK